MNHAPHAITEQQVEDALRAAGVEPCAPLTDLAAALSAQFAVVQPALASTSFWSDPTAFGAALEGARK